MSVYAKLTAIQSKLEAPKNQFNKFGGYSYRNCEDILEALKPLLVENKVAVTISDSVELIGDRYYIKATATLINLEEDKEKISVTAFAREEKEKKGMDASQISGASSSYARKYALNGLFAIDDNKDSDFTNRHGKKQDSKVTQIQVNKATDGTKKYYCIKCKNEVSEKIAKYSYSKFNKILCMDCQKLEK